ncbi:MAG TPA: choice-of-anchor P family protein [Candidatus Solibacter sp.]|nr:choice-of-anchor P family protein [Candidatus Solibacter sp.]
MATQPQDIAAPAKQEYDANAYVLSADLQQPVPSVIEPQFQVTLPKEGTYQYKTAPAYNLYGVFSYESGYTQVSGHPSSKREGFTTLATSVIEGLNVLDVVTADRVVGQISTTRPYDGAVPSVTFLGTRFVNLRIGGHEVKVNQDLHILGPKPAGDVFYFDDPAVQKRMSDVCNKIQGRSDFPDWARQHFQWGKPRPQFGGQGGAACSLVTEIESSSGQSFGNVIDLPHFGQIFLGEVSVDRTPPPPNTDQYETYTFHLTMVRLEMGCIGAGNLTAVKLDTNGTGSGGGGGKPPAPPPHGGK